jgi:hypothetical protein
MVSCGGAWWRIECGLCVVCVEPYGGVARAVSSVELCGGVWWRIEPEWRSLESFAHRVDREADSLASVRGMLGWLTELAPTQGAPARRSRLLPTRRLCNLLVGGGVVADGRGRWAVEHVIGVRGAGAKREAQVRWKGQPWDDEWVPFANLTRGP